MAEVRVSFCFFSAFSSPPSGLGPGYLHAPVLGLVFLLSTVAFLADGLAVLQVVLLLVVLDDAVAAQVRTRVAVAVEQRLHGDLLDGRFDLILGFHLLHKIVNNPVQLAVTDSRKLGIQCF